MKYLILILLLLITACGQGPKRTSDGIDPAFDTYLTELNDSSLKLTGKEINLEFVAINFRELHYLRKAECKMATGEIFVNEKLWQQAPHDERKAVLLHEIGHCVYFRKHDNSKNQSYMDGSFPNSIMTTTLLTGKLFEFLGNHFIVELVGGE